MADLDHKITKLSCGLWRRRINDLHNFGTRFHAPRIRRDGRLELLSGERSQLRDNKLVGCAKHPCVEDCWFEGAVASVFVMVYKVEHLEGDRWVQIFQDCLSILGFLLRCQHITD